MIQKIKNWWFEFCIEVEYTWWCICQAFKTHK
jgi:hypothetical protein